MKINFPSLFCQVIRGQIVVAGNQWVAYDSDHYVIYPIGSLLTISEYMETLGLRTWVSISTRSIYHYN